MGGIKYRPEIDGLRAFAVIPVVLFHLGFKWMSGGFIGVDVFFVISGFLITKTILMDHEQDGFKITKFWGRRIRRIFPALMAMCLITMVAGYIFLYAPQVNYLGQQSFGALASVANILFYRTAGDYWGQSAENSPLLHTWSLSVEEQFYLFFPLILICIFRLTKRYRTASISLLVIMSFLLFLYGANHHQFATFYLLPTRAWELGLGCLLAVIGQQPESENPLRKLDRFSGLLCTVGLLAIVASSIFITGKSGVSAALAIPVLGTALVVAYGDRSNTFIVNVLRAKPTVYIGKLSYSIYLWHWPVIVIVGSIFTHSKAALFLIALPTMSVMSLASYYLIEKPVRRNGRISVIMLSFAVIVILSVVLWNCNLSENVSVYSKTQWHGDSYDVAPKLNASTHRKKRLIGIDLVDPFYSETAYLTGGIIKPHGTTMPRVVLMGNSHALMWAKVIDEVAEDLGVSLAVNAVAGGDTFFSIPVNANQPESKRFGAGQKAKYDQARLENFRKWKPRVVIIGTSWCGATELPENYHGLMDELKKLGTRVLILEQAPVLYFGDRCAPQYLAFKGFIPSPGQQLYVAEWDVDARISGGRFAHELAEAYDNCDVIPTADLFLGDDGVSVLDGFDVLYMDDDHLSYKGSLKGKQRIRQAIQEALLNDK